MDYESHIHLIWFLKNLTLVTPRWLSGASCFVKQWSGNAMGKTLKLPKNIPSPAWHLHGRGQMKSCRKHFLKFFIPINLSKVHNKPSSWLFEIFSQKKLRFLIAGWNFDLKVIIIENWICPIWVFSNLIRKFPKMTSFGPKYANKISCWDNEKFSLKLGQVIFSAHNQITACSFKQMLDQILKNTHTLTSYFVQARKWAKGN